MKMLSVTDTELLRTELGKGQPSLAAISGTAYVIVFTLYRSLSSIYCDTNFTRIGSDRDLGYKRYPA